MATVKKSKHALDHFFKDGETLFVQTATHYYAGTLEDINDKAILLKDAAWVADTGRFNEFIKGSKPSELEPCGSVLISWGAVIAVLPRPKLIIEVL